MKIKQFLLLKREWPLRISRWLFIPFSYQLFSKIVPLFDGLCTVIQLFYTEIKARDAEVHRDREVLQGV